MEAVVTVVTFEDIFQYEAEKKGKYSEDYKMFSAQIISGQATWQVSA